MRKHLEVIEIFIILTVMIVSWMCAKTQQIINLKHVNFIVLQMYPNKFTTDKSKIFKCSKL